MNTIIDQSQMRPWDKPAFGGTLSDQRPWHEHYTEAARKALVEEEEMIARLRVFLVEHGEKLKRCRYSVRCWGGGKIEIHGAGELGWPTAKETAALWPGEWEQKKEEYSSRADLDFVRVVDGVEIRIKGAVKVFPVEVKVVKFTV